MKIFLKSIKTGLLVKASGNWTAKARQALDNARAARCYLNAAKLNHPLAQFNLGLMYAKGDGVERNDGEASMWIRKAAEQGDAGAQFNLATRCHRSSVGGPEVEASESR